jgi:hypothetical protein
MQDDAALGPRADLLSTACGRIFSFGSEKYNFFFLTRLKMENNESHGGSHLQLANLYLYLLPNVNYHGDIDNFQCNYRLSKLLFLKMKITPDGERLRMRLN